MGVATGIPIGSNDTKHVQTELNGDEYERF